LSRGHPGSRGGVRSGIRSGYNRARNRRNFVIDDILPVIGVAAGIPESVSVEGGVGVGVSTFGVRAFRGAIPVGRFIKLGIGVTVTITLAITLAFAFAFTFTFAFAFTLASAFVFFAFVLLTLPWSR
jgi:hypothetical protein